MSDSTTIERATAHTMKPAVLNVGVVGCGAIAQEHLAYLAAAPGVRLDAVCDRSAISAEVARSTFGAEAAYTDLDEMLRARELDVLHVLTPPPSHADIVTSAIRSGIHVVCEKPLALTADDIARLLADAEEAGVAVLESRNYLYNDGIVGVDDLIRRGEIGDVREVDIALCLDLGEGPLADPNLDGGGRDLPGGAVHDFLPHFSSMLLHFCEPSAPIGDVVGWLDDLGRGSAGGTDHLDALVRIGEVRGRIRLSSDVQPDGFILAVRGTRGSVECDLFQPYLRLRPQRLSGKRAPLEQVLSGGRLIRDGVANARNKVLQHTTYHGLHRMLDAFYTSIAADAGSPVTPGEIIEGARLTDRLIALRTGAS